jgi:antitoxin MazE
MTKPMTTAEIVRIGNSKGVRIPKALREQVGLEGKVTLSVERGALVIRPKGRKPREGWAEQYERALKENPEQEKLWPDDMKNEFDDAEWTW